MGQFVGYIRSNGVVYGLENNIQIDLPYRVYILHMDDTSGLDYCRSDEIIGKWSRTILFMYFELETDALLFSLRFGK